MMTTRQMLNFDKIEISFGKGTPNVMKATYGMVEKDGLDMGVSSIIGRNYKEIFQMHEDKDRKKNKQCL